MKSASPDEEDRAAAAAFYPCSRSEPAPRARFVRPVAHQGEAI